MPLHRRSRISLALIFVMLYVVTTAASTACGGGGGADPRLNSLSEGVDAPAAPEFPPGHTWFNVAEPLTIAGIHGKAVLLDFWTLGCINCQHIIPDLERLEDEFGDALVVIGVHSGKYDREHADQSIRDAIRKYGLEHPVVNDPDFIIWNTYGANAWPTVFLIDPAGRIVGYHAGEGVYDIIQPPLADLVADFDSRGEIDRTPIALDLESDGALSSVLSFPSALAVDDQERFIYIADAGNNRILVSDFDGVLQAAIGSGDDGFTDGSYFDAQFRQPQGLALSADRKTLYVADTRNHAVRAVDLEAQAVTTLAGTGGQARLVPSGDAPALETSLSSPWGLVVHENTLFISMAGTHQIWTLNLTAGTVSVFAGNRREGIDDGPRYQATLAQPSGLASDGTYLYWVDPESSSVRRTVLNGSGNVETLVGTGLFDFGDVDGPPGTALLEHPQGIAFADGLLYVADTYNHKIRSVDPVTGEVRTIVGMGASGSFDGAIETALFDEPGGIATGYERLYVADTNNNVVRVLDLTARTVSTLHLSNLALAVPGVVKGRILSLALPARTVGVEASTLQIQISTPAGYHLNDLAPSRLSIATSNEPVLAPLEDTTGFSSNAVSEELRIPVRVSEGDAVLTLRGEVYYCRDGEEAICLIDSVDLALPVTVTRTSGAASITTEYTLPAVDIP